MRSLRPSAKTSPPDARSGSAQRQRDHKRRAAAGRCLHFGRPAVGLGDGSDDGESEPDATTRPGARAIGAIETLEDARGLLLRESRAVIRDRQLRAAVDPPQFNRDRRGRRCMRSSVRQQIVEHLAEPCSIAGHRSRLDREVDRSPGFHDARRVDRLADHRCEIDRLLLEGAALVETREQEQSSTSRLIRSASRVIPDIERWRSSGRVDAPRPNSSA